LQFLRGSKGDRMDKGIKFAAEEFSNFLKRGVDLLVALHITQDGGGVGNLLGQFPDIFFHAFLIGKGELRTLAGESLRDGPANGTMIGYASNEYFFSFKQGHDELLLSAYCSVYCTTLGSFVSSLYRVAPHHPAVHAVCQVIDIVQASHQGNFRGGGAALPAGAYEDHRFTGGKIQVFKSFAK